MVCSVPFRSVPTHPKHRFSDSFTQLGVESSSNINARGVAHRTITIRARHSTYSHILLQYIIIYHTTLYCTTVLYCIALHRTVTASCRSVSYWYRIVVTSYRYRYRPSPCLSRTYQLWLQFRLQYQFRLLPSSCGSPHFPHRYSLGVLRHFLLIPMPSQLPHAQRSHSTQCNVHPIMSRSNFGGWMMK